MIQARKNTKKKKKKDRIRIIVGFRMSSNEAKLRRSLREKSYEASSREMLSHMAEEGTVPRRIPREYECSMGWGNRGTSQGSAHVGQPCHAPHAAARRWNEQQQFCRSASARLPRTRHPATLDPDDDDYERSSEQDSRDGERKIQQVGYIHRMTVFARFLYFCISTCILSCLSYIYISTSMINLYTYFVSLNAFLKVLKDQEDFIY